MDLYSNRNPKKTLKGLGFKDKKTAEETLKKIANLDETYQKQIILTMYYRAKHHPNRTKNMEDAMKVFIKANKKFGLDLS
jgi:hypothetical protein